MSQSFRLAGPAVLSLGLFASLACQTQETEREERVLTAAKHGNYAGYQRRTLRQIPVVVLEPRS